jgi:hypothetical protein
MLRKSNGKNISLSKNYEEYELSVNEYSETFGLSRKEAYNELLRISDKLYHNIDSSDLILLIHPRMSLCSLNVKAYVAVINLLSL